MRWLIGQQIKWRDGVGSGLAVDFLVQQLQLALLVGKFAALLSDALVEGLNGIFQKRDLALQINHGLLRTG